MIWTERRAAPLLGLVLGLVLGLFPAALPASAAEEPPGKWVRKIEVRGAHQLSRPRLLRRIDLKSWRPLPADAVATVSAAQVAEAYTRSGLPAPEGHGHGRRAGRERVPTRVMLDLVESPLPRLDSLGVDLGGLPWVTSLPTRVKLLVIRVDAKLSRWNRRELESGPPPQRSSGVCEGSGGNGQRVPTSRRRKRREAPCAAVAVTLDLGPRERLARKGIDAQGDERGGRDVEAAERPSLRGRPQPAGPRRGRGDDGARLHRRRGDPLGEAGREPQDRRPRGAARPAARGRRRSASRGPSRFPRRVWRRRFRSTSPDFSWALSQPPRPGVLEESRLALLDLYARAGFPAATVEAAMEGSGEKPDVVFRVREGRRRTIGSLDASRGLGDRRGRAQAGIAKPEGGQALRGPAATPRRRRPSASRAYARRGYDEADGDAPPRRRRTRRGGSRSRSRSPRGASTGSERGHRSGEQQDDHEARSSRSATSAPAGLSTASKLAEHQSHLSRLGVFDTVTVTAVPVPGANPPEKSVLVAVVERSTRYVEYGLDMNTQRGLELAGTLGERNLFGKATNGSLLGAGRKEPAELRPRDRPAGPLRDPALQLGQGDVHLGHDLRRLLPPDDRGPGRPLVGVRPEAPRDALSTRSRSSCPSTSSRTSTRSSFPTARRSDPSRRASPSTSATTRS